MLVLALIVWLLGGDPMALLQNSSVSLPSAGSSRSPHVDPAEEQLSEVARAVLGDTEVVWQSIFTSMGREYREPTLVLFTSQVDSACGFASAAVGPFYCPADQNVYLDLGFFDELDRRFGAPGDFAQAYVIAHEVGHHVQNLLGISDQVHNARGRVSEREYNAMSVRLELQADFLAGVWAHHAQQARQVLEAGDVEEGLRAAAAIGDDRLQRQGQGYVVPDSFTHGTSAQRVRWFRKGLQTGDFAQGDTFNTTEP
jgi:predicted metalloprotease